MFKESNLVKVLTTHFLINDELQFFTLKPQKPIIYNQVVWDANLEKTLQNCGITIDNKLHDILFESIRHPSALSLFSSNTYSTVDDYHYLVLEIGNHAPHAIEYIDRLYLDKMLDSTDL